MLLILPPTTCLANLDGMVEAAQAVAVNGVAKLLFDKVSCVFGQVEVAYLFKALVGAVVDELGPGLTHEGEAISSDLLDIFVKLVHNLHVCGPRPVAGK